MQIFYVFAFFAVLGGVCSDKRCVARVYGINKIACICNATYCDTIDRIEPLPAGQYVKYASSQAGLRFKKSIGWFGMEPKVFFNRRQEINGVHLKLVREETFQSIIGFGASFTDAACINILSLSQGAQENLLKSYFSPEGIEYNLGRVAIGGNDFSTHPYTYAAYPDDIKLKHFKLAIEDITYKIPVLQRAQNMSKKHIKLKAVAWSAPPWMKTNNDHVGKGFLRKKYYQTYADYHLKFFDEYNKAGLDFWSVSTGNEPSNGWLSWSPAQLNAMGWSPKTQFKWVKDNLGPSLRNSKYNQTKIIVLDDQRFQLPWWLERLRYDHEASSYVDGIAFHWYYDHLFPNWLLDRTHEKFPHKFLLQSEAATGVNPFNTHVYNIDLGAWDRGEQYMHNIIENLNHWVSGWMDWNLALDLDSGPDWVKATAADASIIVDEVHDEFIKQPTFYAMGHFSKFVPEDSVRIGLLPLVVGGIESVAFKTPESSIVIVVYNSWDSNIPLTITDPVRGFISFVVGPRSIHTITYW